MDKKYQVFISSTYIDLEEERKEIIQALLEMDCIPAGMELFQASDDAQWELIKHVIDSCDYFIVVIAGRYGSVHPITKKSYTQMEYEYALEIKLPIIGFIHKAPEQLPHNKVEPNQESQNQLKLFKGLVSKKMVRYWTTPHELGAVVSRSMMNLIKSHPMAGWIKANAINSCDDLIQIEKDSLLLQIERLNKGMERNSTLLQEQEEQNNELSKENASLKSELLGKTEQIKRLLHDFTDSSRKNERINYLESKVVYLNNELKKSSNISNENISLKSENVETRKLSPVFFDLSQKNDEVNEEKSDRGILTWKDYKKKIMIHRKLPCNCYILGIDFGTTNSVISYWDSSKRKPEPIDISNGFGKIPLPSIVQYRGDEWVFGEQAYKSMKTYPDTTICSIKKKLGTNEKVSIAGKNYLPEEISAMIISILLNHCKSLDSNAEIAGVVATVPNNFDNISKKALIRAFEIAGISNKLICLLSESSAAALSYCHRHQLDKDELVMLFDFGGGVLNITLFRIAEKSDSYLKVQIISESGDAYHGGENIDDILVEKCYGIILNKTKQTCGDIAVENQVELIQRAREAKERLSGVNSFRIPFTFCRPPFIEQISRESFEKLIHPFIEKTRKLVVNALREACTGALMPDDVTRVLLEGGSSQMPWVKAMLTDIFNDENKIYMSERPALDISLGATYYAAMKLGLTEHLYPNVQINSEQY